MKQVKTQKGKVLNMQALVDANQDTIAVSNVSMNARGDILGPGGTVVVPRNKVTSAYYAQNPHAVKEVSIKQDPDNPEAKPPVVDQNPAKNVQETAKTGAPVAPESEVISRTERQREDGTRYVEIEYGDGSVETEELQ